MYRRSVFGLMTGLVIMTAAGKVCAQDAHFDNVRFKKEDRPGVVASYETPRDLTEDALKNRLESLNLGKRRTTDGYWKYEGVSWPEISTSRINVYFDVSRHKRKSVVSMMVSLGDGNFVTVASNPEVVEAMKGFLNRFNGDVVAWQQKLAVQRQQEDLARANRDLEQANKEAERLARRQKKADRERQKQEKKAADAQAKLQSMQPAK